MKVLHINQQNKKGGTAKIARCIVHELNKKYIISELWTFHNEGVDNEQEKQVISALKKFRHFACVKKIGYKLAYYNSSFLGGLRNPFFKNTVKEIIAWKPDILHIHNLHGGWADLGLISQLCSDMRIIISLHDEWLITGHCVAVRECTEWGNFCFHCPHKKRYPEIKRNISAKIRQKKYEFLKSLAMYDVLLVSPSNYLKKRFEQSKMWEGREIRIIPHGINTKAYCNKSKNKNELRRRLDLPLESTIVLFVANGGAKSKFSDFSVLEDLMKDVENRTSNICFLSIGENDLSQRIAIKKKNILLYRIGYVDEKNLVDYFSASDLFVYPSNADTFGLVIAEAMAASLPVMSTMVGAIPELIEHLKTGVLVAPRNLAELLAAFNDFLDKKLEYNLMAKNAREKIVKSYDVQHMMSKILTFYKEILN